MFHQSSYKHVLRYHDNYLKVQYVARLTGVKRCKCRTKHTLLWCFVPISTVSVMQELAQALFSAIYSTGSNK